MKFKRLIRGGKREYRKHGISALFSILAWYTSKTVAPNLRSFYFIKLYERDVSHYNVPLDPYKLLWVNPNNIIYKTNRDRSRWASFASNLGSVKDGDWDQDLSDEFSPKHKSIKTHFEDGVPWKNTQMYEEAIEAISRGEYTMRMATSEEEVLQRCYEIDDLYRKINNRGYKTQEEIGTYNTKLHQLGNEIQVDIGRDGSLLFVEGRHRLSIAKISDIDSVPVIVVCRHKEWMEHLENRYQRCENVDHPDWNNVRT